MKALGGLDFIKYALPAVLYISDGWKMSKLKNAVNLSKIIFSQIKFFMHIFNMSVTCLQSIEKNYWKPQEELDFTKYVLSTIIEYKQKWSKLAKFKKL